VALAEHLTESQADENIVGSLSHQEREVYQLLGKGEGTREIAAALKISTRMVESYYGRILVKLGLNGMYELRRHAIDHLRKTTT
jgi:DNA-binding NarL/FixJ family response regulator